MTFINTIIFAGIVYVLISSGLPSDVSPEEGAGIAILSCVFVSVAQEFLQHWQNPRRERIPSGWEPLRPDKPDPNASFFTYDTLAFVIFLIFTFFITWIAKKFV